MNLVYTTLNLFTQLNTKYKVIKPDTCNSGRAGMTSTAYMCFPIWGMFLSLQLLFTPRACVEYPVQNNKDYENRRVIEHICDSIYTCCKNLVYRTYLASTKTVQTRNQFQRWIQSPIRRTQLVEGSLPQKYVEFCTPCFSQAQCVSCVVVRNNYVITTTVALHLGRAQN